MIKIALKFFKKTFNYYLKKSLYKCFVCLLDSNKYVGTDSLEAPEMNFGDEVVSGEWGKG